MSARIDPIGIQRPTTARGVGVLPAEPVARISHTLLQHAVRGFAIHDDQVGAVGVAHDGAISFDRHGFRIFKQVDADVRDAEVSQAADCFHEGLEH